tara:strand:- start:742 stop:1290 length:549 start_codon:yes stop_codon:yes gene_type:complete
MNVNPIFEQRRTVHEFKKQKVNDDIIDRALIAANLAPCHKLTFPWRYRDISVEKRNRIFETSLKLKSQKIKLSTSAETRLCGKMMNPSHMIVASQIKSSNPIIEKEDYAACSCSIQNMMLSLAHDNVGSKWSTGKVTKSPDTYEITNINSDEEEIIGFIYVGYGKTPAEIKRPKIESIFSRI